MNEEAMNLSIRKFLKTVGVMFAAGDRARGGQGPLRPAPLPAPNHFPQKWTLEIAGLKVKVEFSGDITLQ